jgi:hypothetical protein
LVEIGTLVIENRIVKRRQCALNIALNISLLEDGRDSLFERWVALCRVCLKMAMWFWERNKTCRKVTVRKYMKLRFQLKLPYVLKVNTTSNTFPECLELNKILCCR